MVAENSPATGGAGARRRRADAGSARTSADLPFAALRASVLARAEASALAQWLVVFVPVLLLYAACMRVSAPAMSADPSAVTPSAWGLAQFGSPIIDKKDWPPVTEWFVPVGNHQVVSNRTPGLIYLATPLYWIVRGAGPWDVWPASLEAAVLTAGAVATFGLLIRTLIGGASGTRVGLMAAFVGGLGTTTWAVSGTQLFPHGPDQLLLVLAMLSLAAGVTFRASVGAGLAFAAAVMIRPPLAVAAAVLGLVRSWSTRRPWPAVIIGGLTAIGLAGFALYSHHYWNVVAVTGDPGETMSRGALNSTATHGYGSSLLDWSPGAIGSYLVKIVGALVSPGRGILVGAPFLLLLLPGVRRGWLAAPDWARAAAAGGLLYLLIQLKVEIFSGGQYFWSYRYPLETLTLCAPLLVLCWREWTARSRLRRAWFAALAVLAIGMQALGAVCFHGPYPDTPWTFDNLVSVLTGPYAVPAIMLLTVAVLIAARVLWLGYRPRPAIGETSEASP